MKLPLYFLPFVSLLASCDHPAVEPSQSLVGAKELPTARDLSRETIQMNEGFGGDGFGTHLLSYELRPNNQLVITHYERSIEKGEVVRGSETFNLSTDVASRARRSLWRMRPSDLKGLEYEIRPVGCKQQWDHDFGDYTFLFIKEGGGTGVRDDLLGVSLVPEPESCDNPTARLARALVPEVLAHFPKSKVASAFHKLESED